MKKREPFDRMRGRHKKRASRETQVWNAEFLTPERPGWMDASTYSALVRMKDNHK